MGADGNRVGWLVRRLAAMGPAEVVWRVGQVTRGAVSSRTEARVSRRALPDHADADTWHRWWTAFRRAEGRPLLLDRERARTVAADHPEQVARVVGLAEKVLGGQIELLGYPPATLGRPVDWNHDPLQGYDWPRVAARRIDHRTAPADPKWVWELNRLQHLPWLAQAYLFTGRDEFAECAFDHLDSWVEQNPVGTGIAWRGAFEAGLRSVSVLVAVQGLRDSPAFTVERFQRLVTVLEAGGRACWRDRSRYSSANNHLVGELTGLVAVGSFLPELPRARRWVRRGLAELGEQAQLQVLPDGAGAEQAVGYQMFTAELLLTSLLLTRAAGATEGDPRIEAALSRSIAYLAAVVGSRDPDPRYGDDDSGFALRLGPEEVRTVRDHLALVGACLGADPGVPAPRGVAAAWVAAAVGSATSPTPTDVAPSSAGSFYAPDGGLVVLRGGGQRVTVDVGPLGYLGLAAHGHADALGVTVSLDGAAVVDDPGTASYYGHPEWRAVHRGTAAHATLTVDDLDQSVAGGPFLWSRHARVRVREVDLATGTVEAEHDGYERLAEPVTHRRRVEVSPTGDGMVVLDLVHGTGRHAVALSWPLAPGLTSVVGPDGYVVSRGTRPVLQLATSASEQLDHAVVLGDEQTHLGWWSGRLESREPACLLRTTTQGAAPVLLATIARPVGPDGVLPVSEVRVELGAEARITWLEHGRPCTATLDVPLRQSRDPN